MAQTVRVHSEFQRPDPFGEIVAVDRQDRPREILSPAVARNAFASFQISVTPRPNEPALVYIQENPDSLPFTLYRERFVKTPAGWIPDALEKVASPSATLTQPEIPGQTSYAFWLDLWVPPQTPVSRVRVEVVVKFGDFWIYYPMEVRVMAATVPALRPSPARLADITARSDVFACGGGKSTPDGPSVRALIRRNAQQDRALGDEAICGAAAKTGGPEWYLQFRGKLLTSP